MTLETFFLACFFAGLFWTVLAPILGGHHSHLPGFFHHGGLHGQPHGSQVLGPINPATIAAFCAWFGGIGYLFVHHSPAWAAAGFAAGTVSGLAGAWLVLVLFRRLTASDAGLDPADFELVGVLGKVSSAIRAGGVGEIVYAQGGTRRSVAARAAAPIEKGAEVVVLKYEHGMAEVRRLEELAAEGDARGRQLSP